MMLTDWSPIGTDAVSADGTQFFKTWNAADDDEIEIDLAAEMGATETLSDVTTQMWRLKQYGESVDVNVSEDTLPSGPAESGTVVKQRVSGLAAGRVYRLFVYFGPAGNKRSVTLPIVVNL